MITPRLVGWLLLALSLPAQGVDAPKRSMADGLVRQWIEREQLRPPRLQSAVELGHGKGPMVLLIWRPDGSVSLHELQRGHGDFGPAAKKRVVDELWEEEELEEAEEVEEEVLEQLEAGEGGAVAGGQEPVPDHAPRVLFSISSTETGGTRLLLSLSNCVPVSGDPEAIRVARVDREALSLALRAQLGPRADGEPRPGLLLDVQPEVSMADLLTAWEVAHGLGYTPSFGGAQRKPIDPAVQQRLLELPKKFAWPIEVFGQPGDHQQPVSEGELLVLIDGEATWGQFAPLIFVCAKAGIWKIAFVGQRDAKTRCKLPTHLPFDRDLVK